MANLVQRRARILRAARHFSAHFLLAAACSTSLAQDLSSFKGTWTKTNSPTRADQPGIGAWIKFDAETPSRVYFSWTVPAIMEHAHGNHGANFVWRTTHSECWYEISLLGTKLALRLARGEPPGVCLEDSIFEPIAFTKLPTGPPTTAVDDCDRYAASPHDPHRPIGIAGVELNEIDVSKAILACQAAVESRDDARSKHQLARALLRVGTYASDAEAVRIFRQLADKGHPLSMAALGQMYYLGRGVDRDYDEARNWYEKAAAEQDPLGMYSLGHLYMFPRGTSPKQNYEVALEWFKKSAAKGNASAMYRIGTIYHHGTGVNIDLKAARSWYEKSAIRAEPDGMYMFGLMYELGMGGPQDYTQALEWYEKAAKKGNARAMLRMGKVYYEYSGSVEKEYALARSWYEKAARSGLSDHESMFRLGYMYEYGRGGPEDYAQAAQWYENAAKRGSESGMYRLGVMYEEGKGVPKDLTQAEQWYSRAAQSRNFHNREAEINSRPSGR